MTQLSLKSNIYFPKNSPIISSETLTKKIVIKDEYKKADKTSALCCQIFLNKVRRRININLYVEAKYFDKEKQRVKKSHPKSNDYDLIIEKVKRKVGINLQFSTRNHYLLYLQL